MLGLPTRHLCIVRSSLWTHSDNAWFVFGSIAAIKIFQVPALTFVNSFEFWVHREIQVFFRSEMSLDVGWVGSQPSDFQIKPDSSLMKSSWLRLDEQHTSYPLEMTSLKCHSWKAFNEKILCLSIDLGYFFLFAKAEKLIIDILASILSWTK